MTMRGFRKFHVAAVMCLATLTVSACGTASVSSSNAGTNASPAVASSTDTPRVGKQNVLSLVTCDDDTYPVVIDMAKISEHMFVFEACGSTDKALMIEDFLIDGGDYVSDGLISGPDEAVTLKSPCVAVKEQATCAISITGENEDESTDGVLVISQVDERFAWSIAN